MRIYFASGYSVMNVKGLERETFRLFGWKRLVSFYDLERGNHIFAVIDVAKEANHADGQRDFP